jgi:hypothetical protein
MILQEDWKMKLKIVSTGTTWGTKVVNAETGEELKNVTRVEYWADANDNGICRARITLAVVECNVIGETEEPPPEVKLVKPGTPNEIDAKVAKELQAELDARKP